MIYEEVKNEDNQVYCIKRTDDNGLISIIPVNEANSDYQEYLNKDKPKAEYLMEKPTSGK